MKGDNGELDRNSIMMMMMLSVFDSPYDFSMPPGGCSIWRPTLSLSSCYRWRPPLPQLIKIVKRGPLRYNQDGTKPTSDEA
jgi:hypothetical protein